MTAVFIKKAFTLIVVLSFSFISSLFDFSEKRRKYHICGILIGYKEVCDEATEVTGEASL